MKNRELYFVHEQECTLMTREDGLTTDVRLVPELYSSQEEADTRIILHCKTHDNIYIFSIKNNDMYCEFILSTLFNLILNFQ